MASGRETLKEKEEMVRGDTLLSGKGGGNRFLYWD